MKNKILKYIGKNKNAFYANNYILLDYDSNDPLYIAGVQLLEKLIEKHFDVYYRASYLYIRELRFEEVR